MNNKYIFILWDLLFEFVLTYNLIKLYFKWNIFNKLKTIFIAGKVYGIQIASKVIDGNYHKDEAKDELI